MALNLEALPKAALRDVREFVRDNRRYSRPAEGRLDEAGVAEAVDAHIANMDPDEFLDAWLCWNGIIGWTQSILCVVDKAREASK